MKLFTLLYLLPILILGFLGGIIFSRLSDLPEDFFSFRLIEVLNLFTPLFVALLIAVYVNSRVNLGVKKREALGQLLDRAQQSLEGMFSCINEYIDSPTIEDARKIIRSLKQFSIIANLVEKGIENNPDLECGLKIVSVFHRVKKSVTDSPFNTKKAQFSPQRRSKIELAYGEMCTLVHEYKMKLYS